MRFPMPNYPCEFEVPDAWLAEARFDKLTPAGRAFRSTATATLVPLASILPPHRSPNVTKDWRGLDRARFVSVLRGIVGGDEIEAVTGRWLADEQFPDAAYTHRVIDGFHRFYASVAVGFSQLPMVLS